MIPADHYYYDERRDRMEFGPVTGWIAKEGGVRHNIKRRWAVVDKDGFTCVPRQWCEALSLTVRCSYYPGPSEKELRKPLGFVDAKDILTVCDMGQLKKRDFCIEVITKERTWYLWAGTRLFTYVRFVFSMFILFNRSPDDKPAQVRWMEAFEKSKEFGKSKRTSAVPPTNGDHDQESGRMSSPRNPITGIVDKLRLYKSSEDVPEDDDDDLSDEPKPSSVAKGKHREHAYTSPDSVEKMRVSRGGGVSFRCIAAFCAHLDGSSRPNETSNN